MTKVMTVVGTRPEIIRLSEVIKLLDRSTEHILVHTGQNYDYELNEVFFSELGIRRPDIFLDCDTSSLGSFLGTVLSETERVLELHRPDAFLVLGDTNSSMATIMAKRLKVPTYHMEAGNRSFDNNVPEEINRRIVDHVADYNLVYSEHARRNLLSEGIEPRRVLLTGSPMSEVIAGQLAGARESDVVDRLGLEPDRYFVASIHREENVDLKSRLSLVLDCLERVVKDFGYPVIVSTHPRTRLRLEKIGRSIQGVSFHEPLGFHDYLQLQRKAYCVLSDSGTISEEAVILGFPAVTLRDAIERPEAIDAGGIVLTGLDPTNVVEGVRFVRANQRELGDPSEYFVRDCAARTVGFILSTHARHEAWSGIRC